MTKYSTALSREELLELGVELGGQGLVVARGPGSGRCSSLDDVGHGEGLAGAGDAQQGLVAVALAEAGHQLLDRLGLVAGGLKSETSWKSAWSVRRRICL